MANKILTPSTLWNDFDDTLGLCAEEEAISSENGMRLNRVRFSGRETGKGRVRIFANFALPAEGTKFPALLILPDADKTVCPALMQRFTARGFAVLMPDYRGKFPDCEEYTEYPENVPYANFAEAGRHIATPTKRQRKLPGTNGWLWRVTVCAISNRAKRSGAWACSASSAAARSPGS